MPRKGDVWIGTIGMELIHSIPAIKYQPLPHNWDLKKIMCLNIRLSGKHLGKKEFQTKSTCQVLHRFYMTLESLQFGVIVRAVIITQFFEKMRYFLFNV